MEYISTNELVYFRSNCTRDRFGAARPGWEIVEGIVLGFAAVAVLELAAAATSFTIRICKLPWPMTQVNNNTSYLPRASRALLDHGGAGEDAWGSDMESIAGCFELAKPKSDESVKGLSGSSKRFGIY